MVPKRAFHEVGDDGLGVMVQPSSKRKFMNAVGDVMRRQSMNEFASRMEPFLRKLVQEEVERVILPFRHPSSRPLLNQIQTSGGRSLQLQFVNKLPSTIFTASRIEAEDGGPVKIVLLDATTGTVVRSGPLSSIKIEILVVNGEFGSDDQEDWTEREFSANVVREREGKRPLVTGELSITLKDGEGNIGDVVFTDNSSWIRSRRFRLGARIVQRPSAEVRIREGKSEAFVVKDHRGELYKKHHPPSLGDEIWRLEKIAKDGAFHRRLASRGINTVKDFLQSYETDPLALRNRLGGGISNKAWDTIVEHASSYVPDNKFYTYYGSSQGVGLLFNAIYKVLGATFDGHNYESLDKLTFTQKLLVENLKRQAYKNLNDLVPMDEQAVVGPSRPLISLQAEPFGVANLEHVDFSVGHQDQQDTKLGFNFSSTSTSTSYTYEAEGNSPLEFSGAQSGLPAQVLTPSLRNSFKMEDFFSIPYNGEQGWAPSGSRGLVMPFNQFATEDISQVQTLHWSPLSPVWGQGNYLPFPSSNETELGHFSSHQKHNKAGWCKIRAALKWSSLGRNVANKRMAGLFYVNY